MATVSAARPGQRAGEAPAIRHDMARYRAAAFALFGLVLVFAGGASRYDEPQQVLVRLAAIGAIVLALWPLHSVPLRANKGWLAAVAAMYLIVLVQLVPIPHALWAQLPGRDVYADIAEATDATVWRPLSLTPDLTWNALLALLPATAAGLAALYAGSRGRRRLWSWLIVAAIASALLGLIQLPLGDGALRLFRETSADSPVGLFANRNHQAAFLACALPPIGFLAARRLRERGDTAFVAASAAATIALLLLGIVATASRSGAILGLLGLAGAAWCFTASGGRILPKGIRPRLLAGGVAAVLVALLAAAAVRIGVIARFAGTDTAADVRAEMIDPLVKTALAFMPLGSGFGSFDSVYRRFEPEALLSTIYMNQAHNEPLQLAIEGGVPALAALSLFLAWWLLTAFRIARGGIPAKRRPAALAAVMVTGMLMTASLVDYPLRTPLLGAVFMFGCVEMMRSVASGKQRVTNDSVETEESR